MQEYNTKEKVLELFRRKNGIGNENCYFFALQDYARTINGVQGGMDFPYDGVLLNKTENGIGMFYLRLSKMGFFKSDKADYVIWDDQYYFIPNKDILKLTVKNHSIFNKKVKSVTIKTADKKTHKLSVNLNEPLLPYHKDNFMHFISKLP